MSSLPPPSPRAPFAPGSVVGGRYALERRLDAGGITEVWAALDQILARRVIVEALSPAADEAARRAFVAASANAARLGHPNIVATYDGGVAKTDADGRGLPFIVTERPSGPTLAELLDRFGALAPGRVVLIGRQLARAIEAAHRTGVTHGGISPATVLIAEDDRVKLSRFAAFATRDLLAGATAVDEAVRADVRAAASTLVDALVGGWERAGGGGEDVRSARALRPGIPPSLDEVLTDAQAGARIGTAASFGAALEQLDITDDAEPAVVRERTPALGMRPPRHVTAPQAAPGSRSNRVAGVAIAALLVVAVAVAAFVLTPGAHPSGSPPNGSPTTAPGAGAITITGGASFNPLGDGPENPDKIPRLFDGDPASVWSTQTYSTRNFGNLKAGDGVYVTIDTVHALHQLTITGPSRGWTFQVYVAARPATTLAEWGRPIGPTMTVNADVTQVDLGGVKGAAVLVWMTQLTDNAPYRVDIGEIALR